MKTNKIIRVGAICGMLFPILAFTLIFLLGSLIQGYSHVNDYISEIWKQGSEFESVTLLVLVVLGFIFLMFAMALYLEIDEDKFSYYNFLLLIFFSLSLIFLGVFPCYGPCQDLGFTLHFFFTIIASASLGFSPLLLYFVTKHDKRWEDYKKINVAVFLISLISLIIYGTYKGFYSGLFQRLYFFICFLWVGIISIKLFKLSKPVKRKR